MKTTLVNLSAPVTALGNPSLTPELMAACGARYSRNNEGLDAILSKIDWNNQDASVDGIFKMTDYGHASIADLAPVSIFIDDISILLVFFLWHVCYTASGQESSTRYIRYSKDSMLTAEMTSLRADDLYKSQADGFLYYEKTVGLWEEKAKKDGTDVPLSLKEQDEKKYNRMVRNYAFDRSRYFLPLSALTNVMMIMSARMWVDLISYLLSFPALEFNILGEKLKNELNLVTPRLIKHAVAKQSTKEVIQSKMRNLKNYRVEYNVHSGDYGSYCKVYEAPIISAELLDARENRYSGFEDEIRMTPVKFGWKYTTMGEIRDMNRHRTGQKNIGWSPNGFYATSSPEFHDSIGGFVTGPMYDNFSKCQEYLRDGNIEGLYLLSLGHTFPYEHVTTLDKFLYQCELRTGEGCHFAYVKMMQDCISQMESQLLGISEHIKINESAFKW
jgi:thymidylate synthase ThyX